MALAAQTAATAPARYRLGEDGGIGAWLIAGPFPNPGALQLRGTGFATDYLKPEPSQTPVEGQPVPPTEDGKAEPWRLVTATGPFGIDLRAQFQDYHPGIAYAYARIESPRDQDAVLLFGSDDGAKLWINGELRYTKQIARGLTRDEERIHIRLKQGDNAILFKIEQGDGGWGLAARLTDSSGNPLKGNVRLDVLPGDAAERSIGGKDGSLDVKAAEDYREWSRKAALWVSRFRADADHPERIDDALKAGAEDVRRASGGDANALSIALQRAVRRIEGAYEAARGEFLAEAQNPSPLLKVDVSKQDFIGRLNAGRYFSHANGKPFIPIGYNHNPDWAKLIESNPLLPGVDAYRPEVTDRWFGRLAANGVDLVRLMVETPQSGNLEDPVGTFQPEAMRWLDNVFAAARKHGIRLMVTPYDTFWMNRRWETTTYAPERGGPVTKKIDWYVDPKVRSAQKRRMRWLIDRYGNLDTVFCWEIMNEADIWWGASPAQLQAWADDMVAYVRDYQKRKWGRDHMVSISTAEPMPKHELASFEFRRPDLDFATSHLYIGASKAPTEAWTVVGTEAEGVRHALAEIRDDRPYVDGENGPIDKWIRDAKLDDEVHHDQSWAHLAAGGAGSSLRWPYRNPHHLSTGMLTNLKRMRTFVDSVDWRSLAGPRVEASLRLPEQAVGTCYATRHAAILFVTRKSSDTSLPVKFDLCDAGTPQGFRLFDTHTGKWLSVEGLQVPAGVESVAAIVRLR